VRSSLDISQSLVVAGEVAEGSAELVERVGRVREGRTVQHLMVMDNPAVGKAQHLVVMNNLAVGKMVGHRRERSDAVKLPAAMVLIHLPECHVGWSKG
jgi:hypothetical protein